MKSSLVWITAFSAVLGASSCAPFNPELIAPQNNSSVADHTAGNEENEEEAGEETSESELETPPSPLLYSNEFEEALPDLTDWVDYPGDYAEVASQVYTLLSGGPTGQFYGTDDTSTNSHSYYVGSGSEDWKDYSVLVKGSAANIASWGLVLGARSDVYTHQYVRIRYVFGVGGLEDFHVAPYNLPLCLAGISNSGTIPAQGDWYWIKAELEDLGDSTTQVRAKVWADGDSEPSTFSIDCNIAAEVKGTVGVWGMQNGQKGIDNLSVNRL